MQLQFWNACQKNVFSHLKVILYKTALCKRQKYWPLPWKSQLSAIVYAVTKCIHFPSGWKPSGIFICGLFIMCCFTASDTSSCMPVSSSIITQASMGRAISLLVRFRCSSRAVPNAGFSVHLSVRWWDEVRMIWVIATLHYIWKHLRIITKWVCGAQIQEDLQCETGYITVLFTGRERERMLHSLMTSQIFGWIS